VKERRNRNACIRNWCYRLYWSAIVEELIRAGHQVLAWLARMRLLGPLPPQEADVHRGALEDLESLRSGAVAADGVIHTAFIHDFSNYAPAAEKDRHAIETLEPPSRVRSAR